MGGSEKKNALLNVCYVQKRTNTKNFHPNEHHAYALFAESPVVKMWFHGFKCIHPITVSETCNKTNVWLWFA